MGFTESRKRTTAGDSFLTEFVKSKTFPFLPSAKTPRPRCDEQGQRAVFCRGAVKEVY